MLTDPALKNLKPKPAQYKVTDRDGMYVTISPAGTVTFRYDHRLNGRRETLTIGRYGQDGLSLANQSLGYDTVEHLHVRCYIAAASSSRLGSFDRNVAGFLESDAA
jgi:hypothetical protein